MTMKHTWNLGLAAVFAVAAVAGCGGTYPAGNSSTTPTATAGTPAAPAGDKEIEDSGMDIRRAALPFRILRASGGAEITPDAFFEELAAADSVCLGESHKNPHHHWAQLRMFEELVNRLEASKMALGMEMFQRPFQGVLNDYGAGKIDERAMLTRTDWANRWGYDFALYRPLMALAVKQEIPILALNISTEFKEKIKRVGIEGLTEKERARAPEVNVDDPDHKAWFDDLMGGGAHSSSHGGGHASQEDDEKARRFYFVQVLWDETMAETASSWLTAEAGRRMVVIAGSGHCHESAVVRRMKRRGVKKVLSVRPVLESGAAQELADPQTDYLFVLISPQ